MSFSDADYRREYYRRVWASSVPGTKRQVHSPKDIPEDIEIRDGDPFPCSYCGARDPGACKHRRAA